MLPISKSISSSSFSFTKEFYYAIKDVEYFFGNNIKDLYGKKFLYKDFIIQKKNIFGAFYCKEDLQLA